MIDYLSLTIVVIAATWVVIGAAALIADAVRAKSPPKNRRVSREPWSLRRRRFLRQMRAARLGALLFLLLAGPAWAGDGCLIHESDCPGRWHRMRIGRELSCWCEPPPVEPVGAPPPKEAVAVQVAQGLFGCSVAAAHGCGEDGAACRVDADCCNGRCARAVEIGAPNACSARLERSAPTQGLFGCSAVPGANHGDRYAPQTLTQPSLGVQHRYGGGPDVGATPPDRLVPRQTAQPPLPWKPAAVALLLLMAGGWYARMRWWGGVLRVRNAEIFVWPIGGWWVRRVLTHRSDHPTVRVHYQDFDHNTLIGAIWAALRGLPVLLLLLCGGCSATETGWALLGGLLAALVWLPLGAWGLLRVSVAQYHAASTQEDQGKDLRGTVRPKPPKPRPVRHQGRGWCLLTLDPGRDVGDETDPDAVEVC